MAEIFSSSWLNSNTPFPDASNDSLSKNNLSPLIQNNQRDSSNSLIQSGYFILFLNLFITYFNFFNAKIRQKGFHFESRGIEI